VTSRLAWGAFTALVLAFLVSPLALVVAFSFNGGALTTFPLQGFSTRWYAALLADGEFAAAFRTSLAVAIPVGLLATVTGTMAAFALSRLPERLGGTLLFALALPMMLPPLLLAVALVVFFVAALGIRLGVPTVIAGHLVVTQPFVVLVVAARLRSFDWAIVDAARDLGATPLVAFRRVVLPLAASAIVGGALVAAAISLDDVILSFFLIGSGNTLPTYVWGKIRTTLDPSINAIATILLALTTAATLLALWASRNRS
jgi:spermidine/putrescine transport system permease protein